MEAAWSSETLVPSKTTRCHNTEDLDLVRTGSLDLGVRVMNEIIAERKK